MPKSSLVTNICLHLIKLFTSCHLHRLDLWHALKRISGCLNKKHPFFDSAVAELSKIFYIDSTGHSKPTGCKQEIESNLLTWVTHWSTKTHHTKGPLVRQNVIIRNGEETTTFQKELDCLLKHIRNDCLSHIPAYKASSCNEGCHKHLRSSFSHVAVMSLELGESLMRPWMNKFGDNKNQNPTYTKYLNQKKSGLLVHQNVKTLPPMWDITPNTFLLPTPSFNSIQFIHNGNVEQYANDITGYAQRLYLSSVWLNNIKSLVLSFSVVFLICANIFPINKP